MAYISISDEQKESLYNSERFKSLVEWAILNKARYWSQLDGSSVPGNDHIKWAKSRTFSSNIILNSLGSPMSEGYYKLFLILLTQQVYNNSSSFDVTTVIDYMITQGTFEAVTDGIFDEKIKTIIF